MNSESLSSLGREGTSFGNTLPHFKISSSSSIPQWPCHTLCSVTGNVSDTSSLFSFHPQIIFWIPILKMREPRHRQVKCLGQGPVNSQFSSLCPGSWIRTRVLPSIETPTTFPAWGWAFSLTGHQKEEFWAHLPGVVHRTWEMQTYFHLLTVRQEKSLLEQPSLRRKV